MNPIHSIDGDVVVDEMVMRCNYNPIHLARAWEVVSSEVAERELDVTVKTDNKHFLATKYVMEINDINVGCYDDNTLVRAYQRLAYMRTHRSFPIACIHDSFGARYADMNTVRWYYKEILAEICESDLLESIYKDLTGNKLNINKDPALADMIRNSNYMLS